MSRRLIKSLIILICAMSCSQLMGCSREGRYHPPQKVLTPVERENRYVKEIEDAGAQVVVVGQTYRIIIPDSILFPRRSTLLSGPGRHTLDLVSKLVNLHEHIDLHVNGYTDNRNERRESIALSHARASVAMKYLQSRHNDSRLLIARGYGHEDPLVSQHNSGRGLNNRIEVKFFRLTNA